MPLNFTHLKLIPVDLRRDVLFFDWWIRNADRTLTEAGGNPNLLWKASETGTLALIDHNLAFDSEFNESQFLRLHVFAADACALFSDFSLRSNYQNRLTAALKYWSDICDTLPKEWDFIDTEQTIPSRFPFAETKALLERIFSDSFWQPPS